MAVPRLEYFEMVRMRRPRPYEVLVFEVQLGRDAADLVVLDRPDGPVRRRHRKEAVEQRQLLFAGGDPGKRAGDDEVFRACAAGRLPRSATSRSMIADSSGVISWSAPATRLRM
jgi:hypothetical protein